MVRTGITLGSLLPELVPVYEEREAARFGNYNWREWKRLESYEQADVVAHYRLHFLIELNQSDALSSELKRRSRKHGT